MSTAGHEVVPGSDQIRTGTSVALLAQAILDNLFYVQGRFAEVATVNDWYQALAFTVRDHMLHHWMQTARTYKRYDSRTVSYLSAEFLPGPHLGNNLLNLNLFDQVRDAVESLRQGHDNCPDLQTLIDVEEEPGLGNGGLGRLAACYLDSLASLRIPAIGYGIRYEFGIFTQEIQDGAQVERTDNWLHNGNPWELRRPKIRFEVPLGGHTEAVQDAGGRLRVRWYPARVVRGIAYDTPVIGYGVNTVNLLRLWKSEAPESFNFEAFNTGNYWGAVQQKVDSENLSKVLYPNDEPAAGKELRLTQQYFLVSCSLQDMLRLFTRTGRPLTDFHLKFAAQLNDTHPALAVVELMRLLLDAHGLDWEPAWETTRRTFAYTNHTLLPEALEVWPLDLFERLLPRHLEIIYEINRRFLDQARMRFLGDNHGLIERLSLIGEGDGKAVRMANLACVGSYAINGVAELHTELLKGTVLRDFYRMWPEKFSNKTNGVTPRRFLLLGNPGLAQLLHETIGCDWVCNLEELRRIEPLAEDPAFQERWRAAKRQAKLHLVDILREQCGVEAEPDWLFDIQVKRIHEYKRQHLNVLHIVALYNRIKSGLEPECSPRVFVFGGKAAPGYKMAKRIIRLINEVGDMINHDPDVRDYLRVCFVPNFNVRTGQYIYPAADLSEQISTAGMEASGTGNMKFSMNGALTIGTLDGANVEIRQEVGADNFFLFGHTAEQIEQLRRGGYDPRARYEEHADLQAAIDLIASGFFSHGDPEVFRPLIADLLDNDRYFLLADFPGYTEQQCAVNRLYRDRPEWTRRSILNVARIGKFSSDRAIREYCRDIWCAEPVEIPTG